MRKAAQLTYSLTITDPNRRDRLIAQYHALNARQAGTVTACMLARGFHVRYAVVEMGVDEAAASKEVA